MTNPTVFISYSHKDEAWKDRLVTHLGVLQQEGILDLWDDRRIGAGEDWYHKIEEAIARASVAVLLVSADFLTSNFILSEEIPSLLERRDKEGLRIYPVIIKPCAWKQVKWLTRMDLRPKDGRPIQGGRDFQVETDLAAIAEKIAGILRHNSPHAFVAMPFRKDMDDVFYYGIQGPVHKAGFLCERVDQEAFTGDILNRVKERIETASVVIAELSGSNPNVYLEVGYAWGKGRPTILLLKNTEELRFDVHGQRCLFYERIKDLENSLIKELEELKSKQLI